MGQHWAVQRWYPLWPELFSHGWTIRTKSRQGPLHTATEAPFPVNNPKEVADVSVQTDMVEENAIQEIEHKVEVSTLLDISPVLPDSDDYDSAFESDIDF